MLVVLSIVMQHRGRHVMDWLRISTRDRSAVLACAGNSVGAAILDDRGGWIRRDRNPLKYERLEPTDLTRFFARTSYGFAYESAHGAHLVLAPMWFFAAIGVAPPLLMLAGAGRKKS